MTEFLHHYREIMTDPAHLAAEVSLMLLIDVLFLGLIWPLIRKAIRREHQIIDAEHGVVDHGAPVEDELTEAGRHVREVFAYGNAAVEPTGFVPCAREHEPGSICILPDGHPITNQAAFGPRRKGV